MLLIIWGPQFPHLQDGSSSLSRKDSLSLDGSVAPANFDLQHPHHLLDMGGTLQFPKGFPLLPVILQSMPSKLPTEILSVRALDPHGSPRENTSLIISILQSKGMRLREVKGIAHSYSERECLILKPTLLTPCSIAHPTPMTKPPWTKHHAGSWDSAGSRQTQHSIQ